MLFIGLDLAWGEGSSIKRAAESGAVALESSGRVVAADWICGLTEAVAWLDKMAGTDALLFVDAPLVVNNKDHQRLCEKQVGQRYWRWSVSAHSTNLSKSNLAGVTLLQLLEDRGWRYDDGRTGPPRSGRVVSECYPYTTIVGAEELGYEVERPRYKQKAPKGMRAAEWKPLRATTCDELISRLGSLATADPPLDLRSHPTTLELLEERSPVDPRRYKHREDLIDAVICAWTASLWHRHGFSRSQVLGASPESSSAGRVATIITPARRDQRERA